MNTLSAARFIVMPKLSKEFYLRRNVLQVAKNILGKVLVTQSGGKITSGRIVEVEAYNGIVDKASHAFGGRRTKRNEVMYGEGGYAYVYLCYGIHHLFNVVTGVNDEPHAVLIRALEPVSGIEIMAKRTGKQKDDISITKGPGNLSKALNISTSQNATDLLGKNIFLLDDGVKYSDKEIDASPRIGVDYAGEDALLPYRFFVKKSLYISGRTK